MRPLFLICFVLGAAIGFAHAESETPASNDKAKEGTSVEPEGKTHHSSSFAGKGRRKREKEAEGSQAPNRFEADTVIKSKYQLNGQSLEVDPD